MISSTNVMIAGIGGASLGTEILKSLKLAGGYRVYGCDISNRAFGLYDPYFINTWVIDRKNYIANVLEICMKANISYLIPGGEEPMKLLGVNVEKFKKEGINLLTNTPEIITKYSNKHKTFDYLRSQGIPAPNTHIVEKKEDIERVGFPCIIKPSTESGGSSNVFYAVNADEAMIYADFLKRSNATPIVQEYIDEKEGEFTIGVISTPEGKIIGSIALKRVFDAKLSVSYRGRGGLISSGYSQGYIDEFSTLCRQAESIAQAINSRGPVNIQGRVQNGLFLPFEINPRFSASTYLRALAGFNEIDLLINYLKTGKIPSIQQIKPGLYLRSLTEHFIDLKELK